MLLNVAVEQEFSEVRLTREEGCSAAMPFVSRARIPRQPHEPVPDNTCAEQGEQDDEQQATPARKYSRPEGGYPREWEPYEPAHKESQAADDVIKECILSRVHATPRVWAALCLLTRTRW